jgi:hypothetical protein
MSGKYRLSIDPPASGRTSKASVRVLDGDGSLMTTDTADLSSIDERRKLAKRLSKRLANGDGDTLAATLESRIEAGWVKALSDQQNSKTADGDGRKTQAARLVELASGAELFHGPDGEAFATVTIDSHKENHRLKAKGFRRYLCRAFHSECGKPPGSQALQDALGVLEGRAVFDAPEIPIAVRLATHGETVFLDLADANWQAVEVTPSGWRVVANPPVKFIRPRGLLPLPQPVAGGSVDELRRFVNIDSVADWRLLIAWLVAAMRPRGPFPALVLSGEQGAAKSFTARVLRSLVDPNAAPLRAEPREPRDLMIAASNGWTVALDNLSYLPPWLSDALCRLSTGGGFSCRELYSDRDETIFDSQRPVILTGVEEVATRSDLLDRAIVLHLPPLPEIRYRTEAALLAEFEAARPRILGALLDTVAGALAELPRVKLPRLPRMADFAVWASAAEPALGWERGSFLDAYTTNRAEANAVALDASPIAPFIRDLADMGWEGTAACLLEKLELAAGEKAARGQSWPKSPRALGGQLRRLAPNLRRAGVGVETYREPGGTRERIFRVIKTTKVFDRPDRPDSPEPRESQGFCGTQTGTVGTQTGTVGTVGTQTGTVADGNRPAENRMKDAVRDCRDGRDGQNPYCSNSDDTAILDARDDARDDAHGDAWEGD